MPTNHSPWKIRFNQPILGYTLKKNGPSHRSFLGKACQPDGAQYAALGRFNTPNRDLGSCNLSAKVHLRYTITGGRRQGSNLLFIPVHRGMLRLKPQESLMEDILLGCSPVVTNEKGETGRSLSENFMSANGRTTTSWHMNPPSFVK